MTPPLELDDLYEMAMIDDFTDYQLYANINNTIIPLRLYEADPTTKKLILHEKFIPREERPPRKWK